MDKDLQGRKWVSIIDKLPIGLLLVDRDKVVHHNDQLLSLLKKKYTHLDVIDLYLILTM